MGERDVESLKTENKQLESDISDLESDLAKMRKVYEDLTGRCMEEDSESIAMELVGRKAARSRARRQAEVLKALHASLAVKNTTKQLRCRLEFERKQQEVETYKETLRELTAEVEKKQRVLDLLAGQR